ncbi:SDR family oxidoreductase [Agarilytica rhodophyticola]|uniref:SDR family oxidoreductase n=1 Tax=Agarilytica rhodophyticola TaxID=1737490 RepID=UPI000B349F19|nr:SDR family oxidoreductase [Agarilytica rhodophyticola]
MPIKKVALVTGGNRGIGLAACELLEQKDIIVYMACRDIDSGKKAITRKNLERTQAIQLDVSKPETFAPAFDIIEKESGKLDILVNNAGISRGVRDKPSEEDIEQIRDTFEVNFFGPWLLIQQMLPLLKKSENGHIINVSSGHGSSTKISGNNLAYRSSKSSLNVLTQAFADELAGSGIRVNCMTPGWVRTKLGGVAAPRTPSQGAETILWLATNNEGSSGKFYKDKDIFPW